MNIQKMKNMEEGKFFFLGMASKFKKETIVKKEKEEKNKNMLKWMNMEQQENTQVEIPWGLFQKDKIQETQMYGVFEKQGEEYIQIY